MNHIVTGVESPFLSQIGSNIEVDNYAFSVANFKLFTKGENLTTPKCICQGNKRKNPTLLPSSYFSEINECGSFPCMNDGSCIDKVNGYECKCYSGFEGDDCGTGKDKWSFLLTIFSCVLIACQYALGFSANRITILLLERD